MSDIKFTQVPLEQLFTSKRGNSSYTKKYCSSHMGEYEVYTGTTIGSFAKINTYEYEEPHLTYTTDGEYAGTVQLIEDDKYNVGAHRAILEPLDENLHLKYFHYILESIFQSKTKDGSVPSVTWNILKKLLIPVPLDDEGKYDLDVQIEIAKKYAILEEKKQSLIEHMQKLENSLIEANLTSSYNHEDYLISDLFETKRGSARFTKTFCNKNKGDYPVLSSNTKDNFFKINSYVYDGNYITWSTDGLAGYIFVTNGKFSATDHRGILVPKEEIDIDNLDMDYLKYVIEPIFRKNIKGRMGHNGQNEYTSLKLNAVKKIEQKIPIPIDDEGKFDLLAQQEIARKYKKLYEVKKGVCDKINRLISMQISLIE